MIESALKYAMNYFQIHADQRMKLVNFYVILLAGSLALTGSAFKEDDYKIQILTGASIFIITFVFKTLDMRTSFLIKNAEAAMNVMEKKLAEETGSQEILLIARSEDKTAMTYRKSINVLFSLGIVIGVFSIINGINTFFSMGN